MTMYLFDTIANVLHNVRTLGLDEPADGLADAAATAESVECETCDYADRRAS